MQRFSENLGYTHITREQYINQHVTDLFSNHLHNPNPEIPKAIITVIDGTYLKIQKSQNFQVLRQSFCMHKSRHLLKRALILAPDGYILEVHGPYFADSYNNDAAMLIHKYKNDMGQLRAWFQDEDIFIFDRG